VLKKILKVIGIILGSGLILLVIIIAGGYLLLKNLNSIKPITDAAKVSELRAELEPMALEFMGAFNDKSYKKASKLFTADFTSQFPKSEFEKLYSAVTGRIGKFVSLGGDPSAGTRAGHTLLIYESAKFKKESGVKVTFAFFEENDSYKLSGVGFESPKLLEE
jgi:hypothetical protein